MILGLKKEQVLPEDIAEENELTSHMAANAAKDALKDANLSASDIDAIIVATTTPDRVFPSVAVMVQNIIGANTTSFAFDVQAVCSGFIYALATADSMIKSGQCKNILVIGAEKMSNILDWNDRGTCVLFGDGAGAVILSANNDEKSNSNILNHTLYSDGSLQDILYVNGGVGLSKSSGIIKMEGKTLFKHAVDKLSNAINDCLRKENLTKDDINVFIPHQANIRILQQVATKIGISDDKIIITVEDHANTSAASIPLALNYTKKSNMIIKGDVLLLAAIGGGLTWGATLIRW